MNGTNTPILLSPPPQLHLKKHPQLHPYQTKMFWVPPFATFCNFPGSLLLEGVPAMTLLPLKVGNEYHVI